MEEIETLMPNSIFCGTCDREMNVKKIGAVIRIKQHVGYFRADVFICNSCGGTVITGLGREFFLDTELNPDYVMR